MTTVSIIIKALNEERHIGRAIETALAAIDGLDGEVILADSGSTDATLDVALSYPIRVVQLARRDQACCGAGPQLGYQHSRGAFICLMDGDMELDAGFVKAGLAAMAGAPRLGGVSGDVKELNLESLEFDRRVRRKPPDLEAGEVDRLNGGGLFCRAAVEEVGYFSDRNLHGYEEFDLAVRLRTAGWRLQRLAVPFVGHHGHRTNAYALLLRRWQTRYLCGIGELVRSALGRPHLPNTLKALPEIRLWVGVALSWLAAALWVWLAPDRAWALAGLLAVVVIPMVAMSLRYRSAELGVYSVVAWHLHALDFIRGLARPRVPPGEPIPSRIVHDGVPAS